METNLLSNLFAAVFVDWLELEILKLQLVFVIDLQPLLFAFQVISEW